MQNIFWEDEDPCKLYLRMTLFVILIEIRINYEKMRWKLENTN